MRTQVCQRVLEMKIRTSHSNRQFHNWLLYDIGDEFLERYAKHFKGHLVDLGCGEAPYREFCLKFVDKYTGVDWTKTQHESKADVVSDLNQKIELPDEIADTIISLSVMEHLSEPQQFLRESFRILKQGGIMLLQVPWQWWIHEAPHDFFRYTPYGLQHMLEKAGFIDIDIEPSSGFFTMLVMKVNYFSMRFIKGPDSLRYLIRGTLIPFWYFGQILAPYLDKLDKDWRAETQGYFVVARK
jgi:SAM-dependent methyltransferase